MKVTQGTIRLVSRIAMAAGLASSSCALAAAASAGARVHDTWDIQSTGCCTLVAHAGGSIDGNPYTDSREALLLSIRRGFRLVEMDFDQTREGDWFIVHDWAGWAAHTGYRELVPPTAASVAALAHAYSVPPSEYSVTGTYSVMSLADLVRVLGEHPDVRIITDTKGDAAMLALIAKLKGSTVLKQFVFQAYSLGGLRQAAREVPQGQLILTTYLLRDWYAPDGFDAAFLATLQQYPHLFALTLPLPAADDRAKMRRIRDAVSIPILVHGRPQNINSRNLEQQLLEWGVNGVYVD